MATTYKLHPDNPQSRKVEAIVSALRQGAVALYPTDTVYAIGCDLNHRGAVQRVRQIKQLANDKPLTFLCASLSNIADYAIVSDGAYRLIKRLIPGPFTFLLPATRQVPRLVMNPKRRTTGIRVPDHAICLALVETLQNPIISTSALTLLPEATKGLPLDKMTMFDTLEKLVDIVIDDDRPLAYEVSTILDVEGENPLMIRKGLGWETALEWGAQPV
ncbi:MULTISPECIES: L-threonylcarbamoyladenylate synthase [Cyanophyceae]|uniref:L-threonylcarbamoyladenylate synthase n=1 Tax=Cyanophyceae TaxID=3028117 RepID=UPI00168317F4|nr:MULTISPECIES: L-threonylcarbamoyladenylate synthase [Cyanophyceae]MBD1914525.1 threonylcarbamoyl-AMP synthase [Phormidium sp. FACHB-77]MBD2029671.1 threonylcarbamoyl-AMP synthase [Phormidium sp. FACHB-322]MBD2049315.1 threonylcarbamoyl-AMP synthase [Leptolyngbya sp. FACHB-60]